MFQFLARLILFFVAISVLRSVVNFVQRAVFGMRSPTVRGTGSTGAQATQNRSAGARSEGTTMLQQDPVCGTYVAVDTSLKRVVDGRVIHFCSSECRDKYAV